MRRRLAEAARRLGMVPRRADASALRRRAEALARQRHPEPAGPLEPAGLVIFTAAQRRWAVRARDVLEVAAVRQFAPLPLVSPAALGVVRRRSSVLLLLDAGRLLGGEPVHAVSQMVVVGGPRDAVALAVDRLEGVEVVDLATLKPAVHVKPHLRAAVQAVAANDLPLLDAMWLLDDVRLSDTPA
ncbi:MAG: chemotaxis protein CheW [Phycisphaeraceae bacterium]